MKSVRKLQQQIASAVTCAGAAKNSAQALDGKMFTWPAGTETIAEIDTAIQNLQYVQSVIAKQSPLEAE